MGSVSHSVIQLAVVMTKYIHFGVWKETGLLEREISLYRNVPGVQTTFYHDHEDVVEHGDFQFKPKKYLVSDSIDIMKSNQIYGAEEALNIAEQRGIPFILRCGYSWAQFNQNDKTKSWLQKFSAWRIEKKLAHRATACIVSNEQDAEIFLRKYNIPKKKLHVHSNWVDTDKFKRGSVDKDRQLVINIGRLVDQKNQQLLIRAMSHVPGGHLMIVGEGELKEELLGLAKKLEVNLEIVKPMPHKELMSVLSKASVFVLTSKYEGMPKVLLESMALGVVPICTNSVNVRDVLTNGINGYLNSFDDVEIADTIKNVMSQDHENMSMMARETIEEKFSLKAIQSKEERLIKKLVDCQ